MARSAAIERVVESGRIGSFRLVAELGEGGFAPVFLAVEEYGGTELRTVALKLFAIDELSPTTGSTDGGVRSARDRIIEEARALCRVEHPNVVRFFQIVDDDARGVLGLAMEHVRGASLGERLDAGDAPSVAEVLAVGSAVASALAAVHAVGLVHRDVKPGNIIDASGTYKLIDFGIARAERRRAGARPASGTARASARGESARVAHAPAPTPAPTPAPAAGGDTARSAVADATDATLPVASVAPATGAGARRLDANGATDGGPGGDGGPEEERAAGTMGYIDPRVLGQGEPADAASDLYGLGATLYECLTGVLPSTAEVSNPSRLRLDVALGTEPAPAVRSLAPGVPADVARFVDSLVAPKAADRPRRAEAVVTEIERLRRITRGRARALPPEGPFRGLEPFDARHRDVYCGRATDIATALELLRTRAVLALVGPSGSGKSSLARAGVLPAIADGALGAWPKVWRCVVTTPGRAPKAALSAALEPIVGPDLPSGDAEALAARLARDVSATEEGLVVLIDALEELVTLAAPHEAAWIERFVAAVAAAPVPGLRIVVTARSDLLDAILATRLGPALVRGIQLVAPLTAAGWLDAVDERAAAYGFALDPDLRLDLADELEGASSAMPLVEFALREVWAARDVERRTLGRAALARLGGLGGALANHAEATLAGVAARGSRARVEAVARDLLVALTTPHGTRAKPTARDLAERVPDAATRDELLAAFEAARLVVRTGDEITLAHDALVLRWPRLRAWIEGLRRDRELAAEIERAAAQRRAHPERDALLRGRALADARALAATGAVPLSADARALVAASRRAALRANAGVIALASSVFVGAAVLFALYAISERETRAEKARAAAITSSLIATKNQPPSRVARDIEALLVAKHQCEEELARCSGGGDAGAPGADASTDVASNRDAGAATAPPRR
jgi:serine/threonine protein kinase